MYAFHENSSVHVTTTISNCWNIFENGGVINVAGDRYRRMIIKFFWHELILIYILGFNRIVDLTNNSQKRRYQWAFTIMWFDTVRLFLRVFGIPGLIIHNRFLNWRMKSFLSLMRVSPHPVETSLKIKKKVTSTSPLPPAKIKIYSEPATLAVTQLELKFTEALCYTGNHAIQEDSRRKGDSDRSNYMVAAVLRRFCVIKWARLRNAGV